MEKPPGKPESWKAGKFYYYAGMRYQYDIRNKKYLILFYYLYYYYYYYYYLTTKNCTKFTNKTKSKTKSTNTKLSKCFA